MTVPLIRYPLDPTGKNPNNAVIGEVRELSNKKVRAVSPLYSPFFEKDLYLWDHNTGRELIRGVDYELGQLEDFPTVRFGKGIYRLILITNTEVSSQVRINYQCLGGLYHLDAEGIAELYESAMNDNRPVPWLNITGKPEDYPPSPHQHLLRELYGFEPLITSIERLSQAITLGNTPAFTALIEWVEKRVNNLNSLTEEELYAGTGLDKVMSFGMFLKAIELYNFNTVLIDPIKTTMRNGESQEFSFKLTNYNTDRPLYWAVEHISTDDEDFEYTSGIINLSEGKGKFNVKLTRPTDSEEQEEFIIHLRRESSTGPVIYSTPIIEVLPTHVSGGGDGEPNEWGLTTPGLGGDGKWTGSVEDYTIRLQSCCLFDPYVGVHPHSYFIMGTK